MTHDPCQVQDFDKLQHVVGACTQFCGPVPSLDGICQNRLTHSVGRAFDSRSQWSLLPPFLMSATGGSIKERATVTGHNLTSSFFTCHSRQPRTMDDLHDASIVHGATRPHLIPFDVKLCVTRHAAQDSLQSHPSS